MKGEDLRAALRVYFLFGTPDTPWPPEALLEAAVRGGVTAYQFREKGPGALQGERRLRLARSLRDSARRLGILFLSTTTWTSPSPSRRTGYTSAKKTSPSPRCGGGSETASS